MSKKKAIKRNKIKKRIRKVVFETLVRPRLTEYRGNKELYVKIVVDSN